MLRTIDRDLWVAEQPLRFLGIPVGARMTVVRLASGELMLYSPVTATPELRAEVEALGKVKFLVAPNKYHHLFVHTWQGDGVTTLVAPGLDKKRKDLKHDGVISDGNAPLPHHVMAGSPVLNETVLYHAPSKSLVCCDLVHNLKEDTPTFTKIAFGMMGGYGGLKTNLMDKFAARDRGALRVSLEKILEWDFGRIVMAHGRVFEGDARGGLRNAYRWLFKS